MSLQLSCDKFFQGVSLWDIGDFGFLFNKAWNLFIMGDKDAELDHMLLWLLWLLSPIFEVSFRQHGVDI